MEGMRESDCAAPRAAAIRGKRGRGGAVFEEREGTDHHSASPEEFLLALGREGVQPLRHAPRYPERQPPEQAGYTGV